MVMNFGHSLIFNLESSMRQSWVGPSLARLLFWIWHHGWDGFFKLRSIAKANNARVFVGQHELIFDLRDKSVGRFLYLFGEYEPNESALLSAFLQDGMTFVDIGANSGYFTLLAGKLVGPKGTIVAFEPSPQNMINLNSNIKLNGLENVKVLGIAIGERTERMTLYLSDLNSGDHRVYNGEDDRLFNAGIKRDRIVVHSTNLDEYAKSSGLIIDAIKMDIQGYEFYALQGMHSILMSNRRILLMTEFWPYGLKLAGSSPEDFIEVIEKMGFNLYTASVNGRPIQSNYSWLSANLGEYEHATLFCSRETLVG